MSELPEVRDLDLDLAEVQLELGNDRDALQRLRAVGSARTSSRRFRVLHAWAYESKDPIGARKRYEELLTEDPQLAMPRFRLALLDLDDGETDGAVERLEALIADWPYVTRYRRAMAAAALRAGDSTRYLAQARYVLESRFGQGLSGGEVRDLLDILRLGGLQELYRQGMKGRRTTGGPDLAAVPDSFWTEVAGFESRAAVEHQLLRSVR